MVSEMVHTKNAGFGTRDRCLQSTSSGFSRNLAFRRGQQDICILQSGKPTSVVSGGWESNLFNPSYSKVDT